MWKKYFNFIKLVPGKVVTHQFGTIDFSQDNIPVETIKALFENDFPYLQITPEGQLALYGAPDIPDIPSKTPKKARYRKANSKL